MKRSFYLLLVLFLCNSFLSAQVVDNSILITAEGPLKSFQFEINGQIENVLLPALDFIVVDSLGRRTGSDPITDIAYNEIPNASYGTGGTGNETNPDEPTVYKEFWFDDASTGYYKVKVVGVGTGTYVLRIGMVRGNNIGEEFVFKGEIDSGVVKEYTIYYDHDTTKALKAEQITTSYSLFATHSMHLEQNSEVLSGDVGVNEAGQPPFLDSDVELSIGISTLTAAGYDVKANRIKVKSGATVNSALHYNTLDNNGTVNGTAHTPLTLPIATLPEFKSATPGMQDIQVPQNGSQTIQPGSYNNVDVNMGGTLTFTGGVYHFTSWNSGDNAQIVFQAPSEVRIAGKFDGGSGSYIGPQDTTTITADQIIFYVGGINGSNGNLDATPKACKIGIGSTVWASFYAPNGTLWIRQNSQAKGQFIGKDVDVGIGVKIRR